MEQEEAQVDSQFTFLGDAQAALLRAVLSRRDSALLERMTRLPSVSQADAADVMSVLSDEVTDSLDDDWEPTQYGRELSAVLAQFNAARVGEWP
ncbi:hypothetical protein [Mycolicibacterium sp.]|uniref:hypothetical protein n=1 Tax=Mycolicibacterium sp. TaxID=2320850 RepID=UPI001A2F3D65|nr:hypothetical protein [Mycolicibacterium sp.]MBJ7336667.1 hypothetical protein [Mycolicibacterium sp.]